MEDWESLARYPPRDLLASPPPASLDEARADEPHHHAAVAGADVNGQGPYSVSIRHLWKIRGNNWSL